MTMFARIHRFVTSESGAVTVDWVVLSAAVVGLGVGTTAAVRTGTTALGGDIDTALNSAGVAAIMEAPFEFLVVGPPHQASIAGQYEGFTDEQLMANLSRYARRIPMHVANGDFQSAGGGIDRFYLIAQELDRREQPWPDGTPDYRQLLREYNAATT